MRSSRPKMLGTGGAVANNECKYNNFFFFELQFTFRLVHSGTNIHQIAAYLKSLHCT